jgi:amidase
MARYVEDLQLLLPIFARPDQTRDPDCRARSFEPADVGGLRVAAYWEDDVLDVEPAARDAVKAAAAALADAGHDVVERRPPLQPEARELFKEVALAETAAALEPVIADRRDELSPQMQYLFREMVDQADRSLAGYVGRLLFEAEIERQVAGWQSEHPIAIAPITPGTAFPLGADTVEVGDRELSTVDLMTYCTYVNVNGLPAAAVPVAKSADGLPIGVQVIGRRDHEMEVLAMARKLEQAFGGWMAPERVKATSA